MQRNKLKVTVKVVVKQSDFDRLAFDVIDDNGYIKSFDLDAYQIRQYRGASDRQIIQHKIEEHLADLLPTGEDYVLRIYFA